MSPKKTGWHFSNRFWILRLIVYSREILEPDNQFYKIDRPATFMLIDINLIWFIIEWHGFKTNFIIPTILKIHSSLSKKSVKRFETPCRIYIKYIIYICFVLNCVGTYEWKGFSFLLEYWEVGISNRAKDIER